MGNLPFVPVAGPHVRPATAPWHPADDVLLKTLFGDPDAMWAIHQAWKLLEPVLPDVQRAVLQAIRWTGTDVGDVMQDVLLELHTAVRHGRIPRDLRAWAFTVARRATWQPHGHRELTVSANDLIGLAGLTNDADKIAEHDERDQLLRWIRQLAPPQQAVIALSMDGYSPQEIARELDIPAKLVRIRLVAAREKLRELLVAQMKRDRRAEQAEQSARTRSQIRARSRPRSAISSPAEPTTQRALTGLPPRQQEVLQLSRRGYKPAQIASLLGLSPNTVRVNLCHARKRMRQNLVSPAMP